MKRTALKRGKGLTRKRMKRKPIRRIWTDARAKVDEAGECRGCGRSVKVLRRMGRSLDAAHTIGREYDHKLSPTEYLVEPDSVVELCGPQVNTGTCHQLYDARKLDLWSKLTRDERLYAVEKIGLRRAKSRIKGRAHGEAA